MLRAADGDDGMHGSEAQTQAHGSQTLKVTPCPPLLLLLAISLHATDEECAKENDLLEP